MAVAAAPAWQGRRPSLGAILTWGVLLFFLANLAGVAGSVLVDSFGTQWFDTWFPSGYTLSWYAQAWNDFNVFDTLVTTLKIALLVVFFSLLLGVPAAYALARRSFPGKGLVMLCILLPLVVPPITYGIPFATVLYTFRLGGTLFGVVVANLVPMLPFVILVMTPFIEQIDVNIEKAARMCGAGTWRIFTRILLPLLVPGMLAASVMVLVRTVAMFELTFLTSGPRTQTLVVTLYYLIFASGIRAPQAIDAMAVMYALSTMVLIVIALRFVKPTQLVSQIRQDGRR
jgi:putative spermidine/putrescine transport system permease protein